jgi:shikimate kinase
MARAVRVVADSLLAPTTIDRHRAMTASSTASATDLPAGLAQVPRTVVLVGLMGAGKSAIGRRLAQRLHLPFVDADAEIEQAAGQTIPEIFAAHGEVAFRDGERRVIARLLAEPVHVLATGGGAFIDPQTRQLVGERGISVWLKADLDVLLRRTAKRGNRPLLNQGEPADVLARLMAQRYPIYNTADVIVESTDGPPETTVQRVLDGLAAFLRAKDGAAKP